MIADKFMQMAYFEIWQPRYHDRVVLLSKNKVGTHNKIRFTKAPSMGDGLYYVSDKVVKKCKVESNGTIKCYAVPLDELERLEITEKTEYIW